MKHLRTLFVFLLVIPYVGTDGPPVNVTLLRIQGPWASPPVELEIKSRTAAATAILFRSDGDYIEHHFWVIEQADKSLNFSAGDGHVVAIGTWRRTDDRIVVTRKIVLRTVSILNSDDPICARPDVEFLAASDYVRGTIGSSTVGEYRNNVKLSRSEFESYAALAKRDGKKCATA